MASLKNELVKFSNCKTQFIDHSKNGNGRSSPAVELRIIPAAESHSIMFKVATDAVEIVF